MSKDKVYIETSVVSYLKAWPSRDVVILGHQHTTREWWEKYRDNFDVYTSELVVIEAGAGDEEAARERLEALAILPVLAISPEAKTLAKRLIKEGAFPTNAEADAYHLAIAATNGLDYLLTWNCRHLANATMRPIIEDVCRDAGVEPPLICTPDELLAEETGDA
jgi:predicted nucleic acid-binding protein